MPPLGGTLLLLGAALPAAVAGGVLGFGTGLVMLPLVVWVVGVRQSVPVLTLALIVGNISRAWWSRHELDWRVIGAYLVGAVPLAAVASVGYAAAPPDWLSRLMGLMLLAALPLRRWLERGPRPMRLRHFPILGAATGTLSALVAATGPISMPFFLGYGLRRGAYVGTDAVCAAGVHITKTLVYGRYALLTPESAGLGLGIGVVMFVGAFLGRQILDRISDRAFVLALEILVAGLGVWFLVHPPR